MLLFCPQIINTSANHILTYLRTISMFLQHIQRSRITFAILFMAGVYSQNISAQATGTCTAGTQYCEASDSTSTTTNTNTNTSTNTNTNNNTSTNTSTSTNTNNNTNNNTNTSTSTNNNTSNNTNSNTNTNNSTSTNTNNNVSSGGTNNTNVNTNTNTNNTTSNNTNTNNNNNTSTSNNTNNNNNNSTVASTSNNTNTNNNNSNIDQNVNSTSTSTSNNTSDTTSNNTNNNNNNNTSTSTSDSKVTTDNKSENVNTNNNTNKNENVNKNETNQTIKQEITTKAPPASAIAPSIGSSYSQDLCTTGVSGAFQGQVFGLSGGKSVRDMNCERIKLSKTIYDMGMKVAAVSLMCQDPRVFQAMEMAGTPCPYMGAIGPAASEQWEENEGRRPDSKKGVKSKLLGVFSSNTIEVDQISNVTADEAAYIEKCTRPDFKGRRKSTQSCEAEWHDSQ